MFLKFLTNIKLNKAVKILFLVFFISFVFELNIKAQKYTEYEVKAAYIFNFAQFVDWPPTAFTSPDAPIILGILGSDPFGIIVEKTFLKRTVRNRKWEVKYFDSIDEISNCHILFVSNISPAEFENVKAKLKGAGTLTVGNGIPGFCEAAGIINFTSKNDVKRFEVNVEAALEAKLSISSKLLSLARIVKTKGTVKF